MKTEVYYGTVYFFNLEYCSCAFVGFHLKKNHARQSYKLLNVQILIKKKKN